MADEKKESGPEKQAGSQPKPDTGSDVRHPPPERAAESGASRYGSAHRPLPPLAQQAVSEFAQISEELPAASLTVTQGSLQAPCRGDGRWCLPDVNCSARPTMGSEAKAAFADNRSFCSPVIEK